MLRMAAVLGEKRYGDEVRVVSMAPVSPGSRPTALLVNWRRYPVAPLADRPRRVLSDMRGSAGAPRIEALTGEARNIQPDEQDEKLQACGLAAEVQPGECPSRSKR